MDKQINQSEYKIEHIPGFEHLSFTESSASHLTLPQSVAFATKRGGVLQSAREAWAFRIDADRALDSDKYQSTRTAAVGVLVAGQYRIAFCQSDNPEENILLARPQEGYDLHGSDKPWLVRKDDPVIERMLSRAHDEGRIVPALEDTLALSTGHRGGSSPYGEHVVTRAIIGADLTEPVAAYLSRRGFRTGCVWTLSPRNLHDLGVDDDHVEVRRVGVGGSGSIGNLDDLYAYYRCDYFGRARGVREISRGNKG